MTISENLSYLDDLASDGERWWQRNYDVLQVEELRIQELQLLDKIEAIMKSEITTVYNPLIPMSTFNSFKSFAIAERDIIREAQQQAK